MIARCLAGYGLERYRFQISRAKFHKRMSQANVRGWLAIGAGLNLLEKIVVCNRTLFIDTS